MIQVGAGGTHPMKVELDSAETAEAVREYLARRGIRGTTSVVFSGADGSNFHAVANVPSKTDPKPEPTR
jgi:hypothetical protein